MKTLFSQRGVRWGALLLAALLSGVPAYARVHHTDGWARDRFAAAERMREALNGRPPAELARKDYQRVVNNYRSVYMGAPTSTKADPSAVAAAETLVEMGRRFDDPKILNSAIAEYRFLRREYPGSKYRCDALFTIGEIYKDDLGEPDQARSTFQDFLRRYPNNRLAEDARQAIAELDQQAKNQLRKVQPQRDQAKDGPPKPARNRQTQNKKEESPAKAGEGDTQQAAAKGASTSASGKADLRADPAGSNFAGSNSAGSSEPTDETLQASVEERASAKGTSANLAAARLPRVTGIRHWSTPDYTRVAIDLEDDVQFSSQRIAHPDRIFFDLRNTKLASTLVGKSFDVDDGFLKRIRVAQFQPGRTRVVLEVADLSRYNAFLLPNPYRLIIDIHGKGMHGNDAVAKNHHGDAAKQSDEIALSPDVEEDPTAGPVGQPETSSLRGESSASNVAAKRALADAETDTSSTQNRPNQNQLTQGNLTENRSAQSRLNQSGSNQVAGSTNQGVVKKVIVEAADSDPDDAANREVAGAAIPKESSTRAPMHRRSSTTSGSKHDSGLAASGNGSGSSIAGDQNQGDRGQGGQNPGDQDQNLDGSNAGDAVAAPRSERTSTAALDKTGLKKTGLEKAGLEKSGFDGNGLEGAASEGKVADGKTRADLAIRVAKPTAHGDRSLIRTLGLKIGKIVIDAGHGGHDTGTIGPDGLQEKDLVLEVAKRLGKMLETRLGAEVVYTRKDDTFIPLETRTAIANQERADLFISIHANSSSDPEARGVETYYLNFTSSPDALEVAARENAVSEKSIYELRDLVKKIALKDKIEESREFAGDVQQSLHSGLAAKSPAIRDRGVKKAPFIVLIGANMPSILAEISFVSNPTDEHRLETAEYRQRIAESLYRGVAKYASGLSGVKVASKLDKPAGE